MSMTLVDYRKGIRSAELAVSKIGRGAQPEQVFELLQLRDQLEEGTAQFERAGVDLRAELTQIETIDNMLIDKAPAIARSLQEIGGLSALRQDIEPSPGRWWWYLDQRVVATRARKASRVLRFGIIGAIVVAVLAVAYMLFLRPDEATRERYGFVTEGEMQLSRGNYEDALALYEQALEIAPEDPEINLMIGILLEALDREDEAQVYFRRAEDNYGNEVTYLALKSQRYGYVGWYEKSEAVAFEAIEVDDSFALSYCSLGGAYEGQQRISEAIDAFQMCADLAREQGQNELYVIATSRLAMLLQMPANTITPTPTP
jgi:tetratricopeptide (TPR) repeat protein